MPSQFYSLTWNQYCLKCQGYFNRDKKEWERVGWATWNAIRVHVSKGMPSYKQFMKFLYEDDEMEQDKLDAMKKLMNAATEKYVKEKSDAGRN